MENNPQAHVENEPAYARAKELQALLTDLLGQGQVSVELQELGQPELIRFFFWWDIGGADRCLVGTVVTPTDLMETTPGLVGLARTIVGEWKPQMKRLQEQGFTWP